MKRILPLAIAGILALASCKKTAAPTHAAILPITAGNNVLLLKVDYLTNAFESGKELVFAGTAPSFTIAQQYVAPSDFGSLKLTYQELDEPIFSGTIVWMGLGQMHFPQNLLPANQFDRVVTADVVTPAAGFQNVFNPSNYMYDYTPIWMAVQNVVKVRQYLLSNPTATVKLFLYTPSVGVGNPADWDWIIMLKN